jgi:hypothetical protein
MPRFESIATTTLPAAGISGRSAGRSANRWIFLAAASALAAVITTNLIDLGVDTLGYRLLDANFRFSWSHDLDTVLLGAGMLTAMRGGRHCGEDADRRWWYGLAIILGVFFLDEVSPLHAAIGSIPFGKLLYSPILLALVACLWRLARQTDEWVLVGVGLTTLLISFGMHVVGLHFLLRLGYYSGTYQSGVGIKEGTELAGLLLVIVGLRRVATSDPPPGALRRRA